MNPFILAPARKKDFINRETVIQRVLDIVLGKGLGDVWIEGERQVGKSSLLQYLELKGDEFVKTFIHYHTEKEMKSVFLYVNVQAISNPDDFYKALADTIKSRFDIKSRAEKDAYKNFIIRLKSLFEKNYYPVLLIDEFDSMLESFEPKDLITFIKKFNSTMELIPDLPEKPKAFSCVFAANSSFSDILIAKECKIASQSGLKFESIELQWFSKKYVTELAHKYLKNNSIQFTPNEINLCYKCTQGYPYFTQKMFRLMYQAKIEQPEVRNFEKHIKEELGKEFDRTVKAWGAEKMPKRTVFKIKELTSRTGEKLFDVGLKTLETYLKTRF